MTLALFIVAAIAIPLVALRGRSLRRCFESQLAALIVFAGIAAFGRVLRIEVDPYLTLVAAGALLPRHPASASSRSPTTSAGAPNRAFLIAAIGYAVDDPAPAAHADRRRRAVLPADDGVARPRSRSRSRRISIATWRTPTPAAPISCRSPAIRADRTASSTRGTSRSCRSC